MKIPVWIYIIGFMLSSILPAYTLSRDQFFPWMAFMTIAFACYYKICFSNINITLTHGLFVALATRVLLIPVFPNLSDDIYRFFWDGMLSTDGFNPYSTTPTEFLLENMSIGQFQTIYGQLNSPDYHSIYPPLLQLQFAVCAFLSGGAIFNFMIFMKITMLLVESAIAYCGIKLLGAAGKNSRNILLYLLNPLVIIESSVNLHPEPVMVLFLFISLYLLFTTRKMCSAIWIFASILSKLTSALIWPLYIEKLKRSWWIYSFAFSSIVLLSFVTFFSIDHLVNYSKSILLYFQSFEFNGSIYYLLSEMGELIFGYNLIAIIGPTLAVISFFIILNLYRRTDCSSLSSISASAVLTLTVYYLFATTVHPWYLLLPLSMGIFCNLKYIWVWSFLICLSYSSYMGSVVQMNWYIFVLEYGMLGLMIYSERRQIADLIHNRQTGQVVK